jgi:hypothetical protein
MGKQGNSIRKESKGKAKAKSSVTTIGSISSLGRSAESLPGKSTDASKSSAPSSEGKKSSKK